MSSQAPEIPTFAGAFPQADEAQWRSLVDKVLKSGKFERLVSKTSDGILIQPLYARAANPGPRAFSTMPGRWNMLARIDHPDAGAANAQAKADLADGASGLHLVLAGSPGAYGFGIGAGSLWQVLDGIDPAGIALELDLSLAAKNIPDELASIITESGLNPASARVSFGFDPIGAMALSGEAADWPAVGPEFAAKIATLARQGFVGPFCVADGRIIHAAGGSEAQELAFALSCALAYLRALEASGESLDQARGKIAFRLAADADQFLTLSKTRALRRLWGRVEEACGLSPEPIRIHAETAWRMMSRRDAHVNLLRATVAVFSAAAAGADSISVLAFTQALGLPDAFARRLARNTQLILLEEANIARVADPSAGAGGIETLTEALSQEAWALFQQMEKDGGVSRSAVRAVLAAKAAGVHGARLKNISTRREPLTGVSEFPNIHETPAEVLAPLPASETATSGFPRVRNAEPFERLRDRAETGKQRPRVFLANFGPISAFNARATFARNLFEAGGIEALSNDGFDSAEAMAAAFRESGANIACICSSDALYAEAAARCATALREAGASMIYLTGRPGEDEAAQKAAGVGRYAFAGCDAVALLDEALTLAG